MAHLNKLTGAAFLALGLLTLALAAVVSTDAYSTGASTDATSYETLKNLISDNGDASTSQQR